MKKFLIWVVVLLLISMLVNFMLDSEVGRSILHSGIGFFGTLLFLGFFFFLITRK